MLQQITKQLAKQEDVRDVKVLEQDDSVARELMLVKVAVKPEQRQGALSVADIFRAKVVDVSKDFSYHGDDRKPEQAAGVCGADG